MLSSSPNISNADSEAQQQCCLSVISTANTLIRMANRRELTAEEQEWAEAAARLWLQKKKRDGITQADAAEALGLKTQSGFSQFINGDVPISTDMKAKMAGFFGVPVTAIDRGFYTRLGLSPSHLDPSEHAFIQLLRKLSVGDAMEMLDIIEIKLRRQGHDPTDLIKTIRGAMEKAVMKAKKL